MKQTIAQNKQWIDETWQKLDRKLSLVAVKSRDKLPYTTVDGTHDDRSETPNQQHRTNRAERSLPISNTAQLHPRGIR